MKAKVLTVQLSRDDGVMPDRVTVRTWNPSTMPTTDRLQGSHYEECHASPFDWVLSRIEASLRLLCTSPINNRDFLLISPIFS